MDSPVSFLEKELVLSHKERVDPATSNEVYEISTENIPYIIQSWSDIAHLLISDKTFSHLLTPLDWNLLEKFNAISAKAKAVALRLYGRTQLIFRRSDFDRITKTDDIDSLLCELESVGYLSRDLEQVSPDLLIQSLNRQELQDLALLYNIKNCKTITMPNLVSLLQKKTALSPLSAFVKAEISSETTFKRLIGKVLGTCWKLEQSCIRLLSRIIWLTCLGSDSVFNNTAPLRSLEAQLKMEFYNMLLVRRGDHIYPTYMLNRKSLIYRSVEELDSYMKLMSLGLKINHSIFQKDYEQAMQSYVESKSTLLDFISNLRHRRLDLPQFLRRFTAPYRALRILLSAIDLLERSRQYDQAVSLLEAILMIPKSEADLSSLSQCPLDELGPCRVGHLLNRLLINVGTHGKQPLKALEFLVNFFKTNDNCDCLRAGSRLTIHDQMLKLVELCKSLESKLKVKRRRLEHCDGDVGTLYTLKLPCILPQLQFAPKVEITAPVNATAKEIGAHRPHYIWKQELTSLSKESHPQNDPTYNDESHILLLVVEEWTLRHYMSNLKFECGMHTESRAYHLLFLLLFYDILFTVSPQPPDVFYSYRQCAPLDLSTDEFYKSRQSLIDARLNDILHASKLDGKHFTTGFSIEHQIASCWETHRGERCLWVNWDLFTNSDEIIDLFWCLGPQLAHAICSKLATDFKRWRSGMPDLLIWDTPTKRAKLVEVKGPGDQLSTQQIMWLDTLVRAGADVEICHVVAVPLKSFSRKM